MLRRLAAFAFTCALLGACAGPAVTTTPTPPASASASPPPGASHAPATLSTTTPAARSTPAPPIIAAIEVGAGPLTLVATDDALWVENHRDNDISRVDPSTNTHVIQLHEVPAHCDLAYGGGSIWAVEFSSGTLTRVDAQTNLVQATYSAPDACGVSADGGDLWVSSPRFSKVWRYDTTTGEKVDEIGGLGAVFDVAPAFGSLWAFGESGGGTIWRVDTESGEIQAEIELNGVHSVHAGHGAIWASSRSERMVWRIDPATGAVVDQLDVADEIGGLGVGAEVLWVSTLTGRLLAIEPATVEIAREASLGRYSFLGPPIEAFGSVWVSALDYNVVLRIDPSLER